ncbi:hypothetical protein PMAYCL1PPCAC_30555, partial [Pristionchus mayeri]
MITRESRTSPHVWSLPRSTSAFLLILLSLLPTIQSQFFNLEAFRVRLPGRCQPGYFDCGRGQCVHLRCFHDGKPDCWDGSDEFCFPGHIKCGSYCVELSYLGQCLANSRCNGAHNEPSFCRQTKEKICREELSLPCKGYGECVLWSWARDDKRDCLDGSDLDGSYMELLQSQWIHIMPTSAGSITETIAESPQSTTAFIPSLGGSLQPSRNISDPTPVLVVSPTPSGPSPTLISSLPTAESGSPPGYEPQPPPSPYSPLPYPKPPSAFQPQPSPIVPIVKIQSYPLTSQPVPTLPPAGPIPASGLIPLTHAPPPPPPPTLPPSVPATTPRNPFEEAETSSSPTTSEEKFFGSSESSVHPVDYPEDYADQEVEGTVVPHYGVPPATTAAPPDAPISQPAASIYPVFVGQTHPPPPPPAIQPIPEQRPVFRPVSAPVPPPYGGWTPGTTQATMPGTVPTPMTYPFAPTIFSDRPPQAPISAATPAPPPYRPFSVIPFGVPAQGGVGPTSGLSIPNLSSQYRPLSPSTMTTLNRPPLQSGAYPGSSSGPPLVAIHPIAPLGGTPYPSHIPGQWPATYQPIGPIQTPGPQRPPGPYPTSGPYQPAGPYSTPGPFHPTAPYPTSATSSPYQPGGYRPTFGPPYPYTPPPGALTPIVPSHPTWTPPVTVPTAAPSPSTERPTVTETTSPGHTETTTEQLFIPVGTETRPSTSTTTTSSKPTGSTTTTTESPVETSSMWIDEAAHEAFRNDCEAGEIERVREKHGNDINCPCGPGMMKRGGGEDEECQQVSTSSVVVNAVHLCDKDQILNDDDRALVTLREILLDVACGGSCTLDQMTYDYAKSPESRTGRNLLFEELSGGACSTSALHDCERPAECINHGLQWRCQCPQGYNYTSEGRGRSCEWAEESMEMQCIQILGMCLIWWLAILFLALLALLSLSCLAWYLATRHCCRDRAAEAGYTQTRIKVPKTVKIRPAEGDLPNVRNLMVKNAKGSALRGTVAMAQSKSLSSSSKRRSNLVLPGDKEAGPIKKTIDIVSSDEENMGVPKPSTSSAITVETPVIHEVPPPPFIALPAPVQIDVTPASPHRSESTASIREVSGTPPPAAPTPPPMPTAFAAAQAASVPILTAKPPTPPTSARKSNGEAIETPILEQKPSIVTKPATPPRKESEPGRKTPTPPVAIDSPQSLSYAVPSSVDSHPDAHLTVAAVDVHQNNEPEDHTSIGGGRDRSSSIASVAGLPTIWDSFQVLGTQYAQPEGSARRESSHSLDNALNRRYPEHFYGPIL